MSEKEIVIKVNSEGKIEKCGRWHPEVYVLPGDTVVWTCKEASFRVSDVHKVDKACCACANSPFDKFNEGRFDRGGRNRSGTVLEEASGHLYKTTWEVFNDNNECTDNWDPHIHVG
jgi:hypothetical protein